MSWTESSTSFDNASFSGAPYSLVSNSGAAVDYGRITTADNQPARYVRDFAQSSDSRATISAYVVARA